MVIRGHPCLHSQLAKSTAERIQNKKPFFHIQSSCIACPSARAPAILFGVQSKDFKSFLFAFFQHSTTINFQFELNNSNPILALDFPLKRLERLGHTKPRLASNEEMACKIKGTCLLFYTFYNFYVILHLLVDYVNRQVADLTQLVNEWTIIALVYSCFSLMLIFIPTFIELTFNISKSGFLKMLLFFGHMMYIASMSLGLNEDLRIHTRTSQRVIIVTRVVFELAVELLYFIMSAVLGFYQLRRSFKAVTDDAVSE